jgi:hypothetical protein
MINRDDDLRRPAASSLPQEAMQPDPMLQPGRSSLRGWLVILFAVVVLCLVLYGLTRPGTEQAASGNSPAVMTSPAPAAGVPAPPPQTTTGQAPDPAPASARPAAPGKPGNQGEGENPRPATR